MDRSYITHHRTESPQRLKNSLHRTGWLGSEIFCLRSVHKSCLHSGRLGENVQKPLYVIFEWSLIDTFCT